MPLSLLGHQQVPRGPVLHSAGVIRMSDGNSLRRRDLSLAPVNHSWKGRGNSLCVADQTVEETEPEPGTA